MSTQEKVGDWDWQVRKLEHLLRLSREASPKDGDWEIHEKGLIKALEEARTMLQGLTSLIENQSHDEA